MNFSSDDFLKRIKDRDHNAIEELVNMYHQTLFKGALKQRLSQDQAESVVSDTWGTFFEKVENFKGNSHIRTYLFGIMYNKIKELWRSNKKYTTDHSDEEIDNLFNKDGSHATTPLDPSDWLQSNQSLEIIIKAIERLPENQRIAFTLKEIEGESTENICNILNVTSTNLGVLIYRAKNTLRKSLEEHFRNR